MRFRSYASLRTPPERLENFDAIKTFPIKEGVKISLRLDYFNAFNRTQLQGPDSNSLDSTFGQITNESVANQQSPGAGDIPRQSSRQERATRPMMGPQLAATIGFNKMEPSSGFQENGEQILI